MIEPLGGQASVDCTYKTGCWSYIEWYEKGREWALGEFRTGKKAKGPNQEFTSDKNGNAFTLRIPNADYNHSAVHYCTCWSSNTENYT